jgi:hypothetical protein
MADEKKSGPNKEELDELEGEIEHARRDAEEVERGAFYEGDTSMYADSGEEAREDESDTGVESKSDDQNIAP